MSNLNDMAGIYNRYFSYSDFDNIDYYSDLTTRINQVITWKGEMDSKFNALYESVSKLSEAEINNTIKNLANNAINSLIASTNTELAKKLEKINIIAGNKITVTKTEDSNDVTISADTIAKYGGMLLFMQVYERWQGVTGQTKRSAYIRNCN